MRLALLRLGYQFSQAMAHSLNKALPAAEHRE
jgi:hypothetical protein